MKGRVIQVQLVAEHQVDITHPDKVIWPGPGFRKADLLQYLIQVGNTLVKYLEERPLTLIRYPDGVLHHHFYQKDAPVPTPEWVRIVDIPSTDRTLHAIVGDSLATLLWLGNLGTLEFHIPFNRLDAPENPEWLAFDLDPTVPGFDSVRTVAVCIDDLLDQLEVPRVVKTSGATGLQIMVPMDGNVTYEETRSFTKAVADYVVHQLPEIATIERFKKNRGKKVYVDYLQHGSGRTLIAAYSPRATEHATVSTPLTADELRGTVVPEHFTVANVPGRLQTIGDLLDIPHDWDIQPLLRFLRRHGTFGT